jgi:GNAT superfamily N-acetyltransferase
VDGDRASVRRPPDASRRRPQRQLIELRRASERDAEAIAAVHCESALLAYRNIFPPDAPKPTPSSLLDEWRQLCALEASEVFVAVEGEDIVGVGALVQDADLPAGLVLKRLYVAPTRWGSGIGASLHDRLLVEAIARGATTINLWVLERNVRARAMYERWGWEYRPGPQLGNGFPEIVDVLYERDLRPGPPVRR